jgi:Domain of unknown function (DUF932)
MARLASQPESFIRSFDAPEKTRTYTPVSHSNVIDLVKESLHKKGLEIVSTDYRASKEGRVVQAIYNLSHRTDKEIGMMFAWANSYDKSMRFKAAIGGQVIVCSNGMIRGDMSSYSRKHNGNADEEIFLEIENQLLIAENQYNKILLDRDVMKEVVVPEKRFLEVIGGMFFKHDLINTEQMSVIKTECLAPSYDYDCGKDTLWATYQHITHSLKTTHPRDYMAVQQKVHKHLCTEFNVNVEEPTLIPV